MMETNNYKRSDTPNVFIHVSFDVSSPLNIASQSEGTTLDYSQLFGNQYNRFTPASRLGVSSSSTKSSHIYQYTKSLNLIASNSKNYELSDGYIWKIQTQITDANKSIRSVMPPLLFAATDYVGKSAEQIVLLSPFSSDFMTFFEK